MRRSGTLLALLIVTITVVASGCFMVGPDYVQPEAETNESWRPVDDEGIELAAEPINAWWEAFGDPVLDELIVLAYRQNPTLEQAGLRVVEAQARRGIAIGALFPQTQEARGGYQRTELSKNTAGNLAIAPFSNWQAGFDAAWELDVWGRFRRGIEEADAQLLGAVASYDDVLVSLIAEVASNYVLLRSLEERLVVERRNAGIQGRTYEIVEAKFNNGFVTELDLVQARALVRNTESFIPVTEAELRQTENTLAILLGSPPRDLSDLLGGPAPIPVPPPQVAVGIPADLLRRRPDVRTAERRLAAQSARIGVAYSDLLPRFLLAGSIGLSSEDLKDFFEGDSYQGFGGPEFRWAILSYGRIRSNIRVQDARYQQLVSAYEDTVLRAQGEVENAVAAFLGTQRQVALLKQSVEASQRAVEIANLQYREGLNDYGRVLVAQEFLSDQENVYVRAQGAVGVALVAVYKGLGGGWALRGEDNFIRDETAEQMRDRTNWGRVLDTGRQSKDVGEAEAYGEQSQGWWRWRLWLPTF